MLRRRISKVLVANRGEIAVRVIKTCRRLGILTVAVYSDADANAVHVQMGDEAVHIGPAVADESYLNISTIIAACLKTGADAVHPGYGFLSENAAFAKQCADNGIIFIGPRPESILAIGDKISSKVLLASKAPQVPLLPGYNGNDQRLQTLLNEALRIGFPVLLKASAGGGGKGMRVVRNKEHLEEEIKAAQGEAQRSFGDSRLLIEKYIETARHIEVQIFGDMHGDAISIFERECSVQRRHQKIIEECPSPFLTPSLRQSMTSSAVAITNLISYVGAGTVEFIVDGATGKYYFLEVNTRLQVEHPVTEAVTGLDLVALQIWIAQGESLKSFLEVHGNISMKGHAIECRIYAEDPGNEFFPVTGTISKFSVSDLTGVRSDSGILTGSEITSYYDPLISKLTVHAETRAEAIRKMASVLRGVELFGLAAHNVGFLGNVIGSAEFQSGVYDTGIVGRLMKIESSVDMSKRLSYGLVAATIVGWHLRRVKTRDGPFRRIRSGFRNVPHKPQTYQLQDSKGTVYFVEYTVDDTAVSPVFEFKIRSKKEGKAGEVAEMHSGTVILTSATFNNTANSYINGTARIALDGVQRSISFSQSDTQIFVHSKDWEGYFQTFNINDVFKSKDSSGAGHDGVLISPMPCRIISVNSVTGSKVKPGDVILTIESMKMETKVRATVEGVVTINVKEGDMLKAGEVVALIAPLK